MPRVVRDVFRITRVVRPPAREPPVGLTEGEIGGDTPGLPAPAADDPDPAPEVVEWQVVIFIRLLPD